MGKLLKIYTDSPNEKHMRQVVDMLENDAVIVYPTDTLYALGCSLMSPKAIARVKRIKAKEGNDLSLICPNLKHIADYAKVSDTVFKLLKRNTPGSFTFILNASARVPAKFLEKKKTVGIRIPDHPVALMLTQMLGYPLVSTSVPALHIDPQDIGHPELLFEEFGEQVDLVMDAGQLYPVPSTVVDCTTDEVEIIRQGKAELN